MASDSQGHPTNQLRGLAGFFAFPLSFLPSLLYYYSSPSVCFDVKFSHNNAKQFYATHGNSADMLCLTYPAHSRQMSSRLWACTDRAVSQQPRG